MERPFVYIAALRRSGSTILSESLTDWPRSFIFREPSMARGKLELKPDDVERFRSVAVDLEGFRRRWITWWRRGRIVRAVHDELLPLIPQVQQVGVKEIFHDNWERYHRVFPEMRVVVLGRDPRDIYLSLSERRAKGIGLIAHETFTPESVAHALMHEFHHQRDMTARCDTMRVRYEELCTDPEAIERVLEFVESPLDAPGRAGQFNEVSPQRQDEAGVHGGQITGSRLARWKGVDDPELQRDMQVVFDRMSDYNAFWGYSADCHA